MFVRAMSVIGLVVLMVPMAAAQDETPLKPLKVGDPVPATFRAFVTADERFEKGNPRNRVNKLHDLVTDNGLNPVLAVFTRKAPDAKDAETSSPTALIASEVSKLVTKYKADRLGGFVSFITLDKDYEVEDDRDTKAAAVGALSAQLKAGNVPFTLAKKSSDATKAWGIADKTEVTVIYYDRMTVKHLWTFAADKAPTADDVKAIAAAVEADLKPKK